MEVKLVFINKDCTTQTFPLPSAVTFIGRRQDCDMCIPLSVVSRRHCEIDTEYGKVLVRDLKSNNGTFVNDQSIDEVQLNAGDVLRIGPVQFVIQIDGIPKNFDKYLPKIQAEKPAEAPPAPAAPSQDETQEADAEEILEVSLDGIAGQSQTMDIDNIFNNGLMGDDDFDIDSDLG